MRIFLDTNVLISAALFPKSTPYYAFVKAVSSPNVAMISDVVVEEMHRTFNRKFPKRLHTLDAFLSMASSILEIVNTPNEIRPEEALIRDEKDRPVLRAAITHKADVFLTGDKDFLESSVMNPKMVSPGDFLEMA